MITKINNREDIASVINLKLTEKSPKKVQIAKDVGISRGTLYKIIQKGGRKETYSVDSMLKICDELGVKIKLEY